MISFFKKTSILQLFASFCGAATSCDTVSCPAQFIQKGSKGCIDDPDDLLSACTLKNGCPAPNCPTIVNLYGCDGRLEEGKFYEMFAPGTKVYHLCRKTCNVCRGSCSAAGCFDELGCTGANEWRLDYAYYGTLPMILLPPCKLPKDVVGDSTCDTQAACEEKHVWTPEADPVCSGVNGTCTIEDCCRPKLCSDYTRVTCSGQNRFYNRGFYSTPVSELEGSCCVPPPICGDFQCPDNTWFKRPADTMCTSSTCRLDDCCYPLKTCQTELVDKNIRCNSRNLYGGAGPGWVMKANPESIACNLSLIHI